MNCCTHVLLWQIKLPLASTEYFHVTKSTATVTEEMIITMCFHFAFHIDIYIDVHMQLVPCSLLTFSLDRWRRKLFYFDLAVIWMLAGLVTFQSPLTFDLRCHFACHGICLSEWVCIIHLMLRQLDQDEGVKETRLTYLAEGDNCCGNRESSSSE